MGIRSTAELEEEQFCEIGHRLRKFAVESGNSTTNAPLSWRGERGIQWSCPQLPFRVTNARMRAIWCWSCDTFDPMHSNQSAERRFLVADSSAQHFWCEFQLHRDFWCVYWLILKISVSVRIELSSRYQIYQLVSKKSSLFYVPIFPFEKGFSVMACAWSPVFGFHYHSTGEIINWLDETQHFFYPMIYYYGSILSETRYFAKWERLLRTAER